MPPSSLLFFDDLVTSFYERLGADFRDNIRAGQICGAPVCFSQESGELWRPVGYDGTQTQAQSFQISPPEADAYRRQFPLTNPRLEVSEEFPVIRAKRRPVIIIRPAPKSVPAQFPANALFNWSLAIVVPLYSLENKAGESRVPLPFLERVRCLEFPELFFFPNCEGALRQDSVLSITRLANVHQSQLSPSPYKVSNEAFEVLLGQLRFYFENVYEGKYADARELLIKQAPS